MKTILIFSVCFFSPMVAARELNRQEVLSSNGLVKLREHFKASDILDAAKKANSIYPPAARVYEEFGKLHFSNGSVLSERDRELIIIAILTSQKSKQALSLHCYWGLMVGLRPDQIAAAINLTSFYSGVEANMTGLQVLEATLTTLQKIAEELNEPRVHDVIKKLLGQF